VNYSSPSADNQLKDTILTPEIPFLTQIPKTLRPYPNWVPWAYHQSSCGNLIKIPASDPGTLDETLKRCKDEALGLGFLLTLDDPITVICIKDCLDAGGKIYPDAQEVVKLANTYTEIDDNISELYVVGYAEGLWNVGTERIRIHSDRFIVPITGHTLGIFPDVVERSQEFAKVSRRYCAQSWMERFQSYEFTDGQTEASVLLALLKEGLLDDEWLENADTTDLWPFLNRCYKFTEPRLYFRSYMRVNRYDRNLKHDIEQFIKEAGDEPPAPREEKKNNNSQPVADRNGQIGLDEMLQYDAKGSKVLENFYNIALILEHHDEWHDRIRFDAFRNLPMLDDNPVSDTTEYRISEWLGKNYEFGGNKRQILSDAIKAVASKNGYDALVEWIDSLPDWDGTQRIDTWMIDLCGSEKSAYSRWVSRVTLLQMMNRALNPGCIARLVPIWNGLENQGKSTAVALLGGEWATTLKISLENKEAHMAIHGYWVAELEELDTLYKTSEARLKAFLTNTSDHYVPKYANHSVDYPRRTVFIGTTNDSDYLRGLTGNTRFLPINTGAFDLEGIKNSREQLFAEAKEWLLENAGVAWWQEPESLRDIIKEQRDSRRLFNVYEDDLRGFLDGDGGDNYFEQVGKKGPKTPRFKYLKKTTITDILELYIKTESKEKWKDEKLTRQIREALKALGWYPKKANSTNWWMRPDDIDDDEVPF
jgi:Virulence-associated protein E